MKPEKLELELLQPVRLIPSVYRFLKVSYESRQYELGRELASKASIVNFSNCVRLLKECGINFHDNWVSNPNSTPELPLPNLKVYKLDTKSRTLASISLTAYQNRAK